MTGVQTCALPIWLNNLSADGAAQRIGDLTEPFGLGDLLDPLLPRATARCLG